MCVINIPQCYHILWKSDLYSLYDLKTPSPLKTLTTEPPVANQACQHVYSSGPPRHPTLIQYIVGYTHSRDSGIFLVLRLAPYFISYPSFQFTVSHTHIRRENDHFLLPANTQAGLLEVGRKKIVHAPQTLHTSIRTEGLAANLRAISWDGRTNLDLRN